MLKQPIPLQSSPARQRGSAAQSALNVAFAMVLAFIGFKSFDLYWDNWKITKLFENLQTELPAKPYSEKEIEKRIQRQFETVDDIRGINVAEALTLKKKKGRSYVTFDFEKRINFFGNIYLVGAFSHGFDYATPTRK